LCYHASSALSFRYQSVETLIRDLKHYFRETLGIQIEPKLWKGNEDLPFFLHDLYVFYTISLQGKPCILMVARESEVATPTNVRKHIALLHVKAGIPCIYVSKTASSYNRKRLVKQGVQFVIPHKQIYLPSLGIDWLDICRYCHEFRVVSKLTPSTQVVVLYALLHEKNQFFPLALAKALNYSTMTMTRALNELEGANLGKTTRKGKERLFTFSYDLSLLWMQAEPLMQNPVKRRVWLELKAKNVKEIKSLKRVLAGFSALAEQSMLSSPAVPIYAVCMRDWKALEKSINIHELPSEEGADIEIEIWKYDPRLFTKDGVVDTFSLYLSLRENQDERVEAELQKFIKKALNGKRFR
jgi:hypothetical protein